MPTDYTPVNPNIYKLAELKQTIKALTNLHKAVERGDLDQHLSPSLLVAIDCVNAQIKHVKRAKRILSLKAE